MQGQRGAVRVVRVVDLDVEVRLRREADVAGLAEDLALPDLVADLHPGRAGQRVEILDDEAAVQAHAHRVPVREVGGVDPAALVRLGHLVHDAVADAQDRRVAPAPQVDRMEALREEVRQVPADALRAQVGPGVGGEREAERRRVPASAARRPQRRGRVDQPLQLYGEERRAGLRFRCPGAAAPLLRGTPRRLHTAKFHCSVGLGDDDEGRHGLLLATLGAGGACHERLSAPILHVDGAKGQVREARVLGGVRDGEHLALGVPLERRVVLLCRLDTEDEGVRLVHHHAAPAGVREVVPREQGGRLPVVDRTHAAARPRKGGHAPAAGEAALGGA
mmetsp:Transcript_76623/g.216686  ORF Transcript_76623/g.216686 Transcript_76623/m.216686 type:complete len:334 (-) Transcript_76623:1-1002(-)